MTRAGRATGFTKSGGASVRRGILHVVTGLHL
jgi:hypothetical protein